VKLICQEKHGLFTNYENLILRENSTMSYSINFFLVTTYSIHLTSQHLLLLKEKILCI